MPTDRTDVKLRANVNDGLFRLVSYHRTIVYLQAETATPRREKLDSCYTNALQGLARRFGLVKSAKLGNPCVRAGGHLASSTEPGMHK